jgi:hypothetical protein
VVVIDHRRPFHISASGNVLRSGSVVKPTAVQKLRDVQDTPQNWASGALGARPGPAGSGSPGPVAGCGRLGRFCERFVRLLQDACSGMSHGGMVHLAAIEQDRRR